MSPQHAPCSSSASDLLPSEPSLEGLYREHFAKVWSFLRRLGVPEAHLDDAAQDVFLVVGRRLNTLTSLQVARAWVMGIAYRVASDYRKREKRQAGEAVSDTLVDPRPDPQRSSEIREAVALLHLLLDELDDDKRPVFVLVELEQLSVVEAAEVLAVNLNTAHARLRAARAVFDKAHQRILSIRHRQEAGRNIAL